MINGVEGPSGLTLHDSHANLFDVLITWLFTLKKRKNRRFSGFHNIVEMLAMVVWSHLLPLIVEGSLSRNSNFWGFRQRVCCTFLKLKESLSLLSSLEKLTFFSYKDFPFKQRGQLRLTGSILTLAARCLCRALKAPMSIWWLQVN